MDKGIKETWSVYTRESCPATKKNGTMAFTGKRTDEAIMSGKISQLRKLRAVCFSDMWELQRKGGKGRGDPMKIEGAAVGLSEGLGWGRYRGMTLAKLSLVRV